MAEPAADLPVEEETGRRVQDAAAAPELTVVSSGPQAAAEEPATDEEPTWSWAGHLRPPDVWREPIPSLAQQWARLREGAHLPDAAALKVATGTCLGLASLLGMAAVLLHWAAASPARLAALGATGTAAYVVGSTLVSLLTALIPNL